MKRKLRNFSSYMQTIYVFLAKKVAYLPQKLFDVARELGFLGPAVSFEGLADVTLHIGCHGTGAVVVLVIPLMRALILK